MSVTLGWVVIAAAALGCYGVWWITDRLFTRWWIRQELRDMQQSSLQDRANRQALNDLVNPKRLH